MTTNTVDISKALANILRPEQRYIRKIDLSHNCFGASGKLSILLENGFPELHTLILSDCELNCVDLKSLARAKVEGKIPELKHLDISLNDKIHGHVDFLFDNSSWNSLLSLNVQWSTQEVRKVIQCQVCSPCNVH